MINDWIKHWVVLELEGWFFYDPENNRFGPYSNKNLCVEELLEYSKWYH